MVDITKIAAIYADAEHYSGMTVTVGGWAKTIRDLKTFGFIELNDGTCFKNLQIVLEDGHTRDFASAVKITLGSAIRVTGELVLTPGMKQPFEVKASQVEVLGLCAPDFPLQKKRHSFEFLRTIAHLRPRTNTFYAVFRIRSLAAQLLHAFFAERGFVYVHTPIITTSDCEGAGGMFQITTLNLDELAKAKNLSGVDYKEDFFGKKASITGSGQLHGETFAMAFSDIYTFGPTFRSEKSNTSRHAAEFWMIEPEMAFCDLKGDMDIAEAMVKFIIAHVSNTCPDELNFLNQFVDKGLLDRLKNVSENDFVRLSYTEAIEILKAHADEFDDKDIFWGKDLQSEHERYLTEKVYKKPVFLTDYPKEIKSYYMKQNADGKTVAAADLLVPGIGELIGGSQREDDYEKLKARMTECNVPPEEWYLNLRKYGGTTHSGFGLGFERMVMYLTGVSNIRDVIPFPRTVSNLDY